MIRDNDNLLDFKPVSQSQLASITNSSARQIELAEQMNNETMSQLEKFTELSKIRWQSIKYQTTSWDQLLSWSLIGINLGITLLFGLCLLRLACKNNTGVTIMNTDQSNGDYEALKAQIHQWEEDLDRLLGRIVGVEGDLMAQQLATNTCTNLTPTTNVTSIEEIED